MTAKTEVDTVKYMTDLASSSNSHQTFMSLPREIRDAIYHLALSSSAPITVWKGERVQEPQFDTASASYEDFINGTYIWRRFVDHQAMTTWRSAVATNLLFCTRTVSREAAAVIYKQNIFCFRGEHNWDPVLSWLQAIGKENRNHLSTLDINAYKPDQVWQRFNGERVPHPNLSTREIVYPRSSYLGIRRRPFRYGLVDNINPAVETIFQLLGQRTSTQQLKITFNLSWQYPGQGSIIEEEDQCPEDSWHSMDLPNLIEKLRTVYACKPGLSKSEPLCDVSWKGSYRLPVPNSEIDSSLLRHIDIQDHLQNMEDHGWDVEYQNSDGVVPKVTFDDQDIVMPTYILRRKKLDGPLMGEEPNPHSGIFIHPGSEEAAMDEVTGWYANTR